MADLDISSGDYVDKRTGRGITGTSSSSSEYANQATIGSLKARLTALDSTSFTAARLATMTENDMIYALRVRQESAGI